MLNYLRRHLDEIATIVFLLIVLVLTIARPPVYATPGGLLLAQIVLWGAGILLAALLIAARFNARARSVLYIILEIGPIVVAVVGYVSLRLFRAHDITTWLGIHPKDQWMMAADNFLFGKIPYLWFSQWGLESIPFLRIMSYFYGLYPFTPLIALAWFLYKGDDAQFRLIRRTLLISFFLGYSCYILIPVAGPLSITPNAPLPYIETTAGYIFLAGNFRFEFDCFPSLHTANPWLLVWLSRGKLPGWLMTAAIVACCGITLSTVALEVHYGIDDLAALAWIFPIALLGRASLPRESAA
jgi:hypothetical protein